MVDWNNAQKHEAEYWRNCYDAVAFGEVQKQVMYAREMSITEDYGNELGDFNLQGKSIFDIGCGPWSMLLRCYNTGRLVGLDPLKWPPSIYRRYKNYGIQFLNIPAEELGECKNRFDEVWIYNVLQHVNDPERVINIAKTYAPILRIFEWPYIPADACHPHVLTPEGILNWLACKVKKVSMKHLREYWSDAQCFAGVFEC